MIILIICVYTYISCIGNTWYEPCSCVLRTYKYFIVYNNAVRRKIGDEIGDERNVLHNQYHLCVLCMPIKKKKDSQHRYTKPAVVGLFFSLQ
jgi:hypothetical protein